MSSRPPTYDHIGAGYTHSRRPDPRIAAAITAALGPARTVVNVGAGAGSYEPGDRWVLAVEPSAVMIGQRAPGSAPAVVASAESIPLADRAVDAAMASLSLHHWSDWRAGLAEMRRVARERIVLFSWDRETEGFWLTRDYLGWLVEWDATRFPAMRELCDELPGAVVEAVPVARDCTDGFLAAFFARPEAYLDAKVRDAMSFFALAPDPERVKNDLARLADDLRSGVWDDQNPGMRTTTSIDAGYRLIVAPL